MRRCLPISKFPSGEPPYVPNEWKSSNNVLYTHNCYSYMLQDLFTEPRKYHKPQPDSYHQIKTKKYNYKNRKIHCNDVEKGVMNDNPYNIKKLSIQEGKTYKCPSLHYKGYLMVSPGNDYHFARQDNKLIAVYNKILRNKNINSNRQLIDSILKYSEQCIPEIVDLIPKSLSTKKQKVKFLYINSKTWSHKPGSTGVTDKDASGKLIFNPLEADWDYSKKGGINYNKKCCFFSIPINTHKSTHSTGIPSVSIFNKNPKLPTNKTRKDISVQDRHHMLDKKIRNIIFTNINHLKKHKR